MQSIPHHIYLMKNKRKGFMMEKNKELKKELYFYIGILAVLIIIIVCNNLFWKIGKEQEEVNTTTQNNTTYFESGNVIYDVPYEEEWLD